ncbi:MAG: hypothetical protein A3F14_01965 [Gammaproteobacteria bacterium RIFCSPHIGHO2_12_FULL_43_28]|nr:MAG: hypothetical protein A3F14_01965 [Gammaproteobacteria bacterium RIFCSPHIGHO2_12_FULL_43_28]
MQPKWLFALCLTLLTQIALAETCPTVSAIKHGALNGWQVYDSDDNKPLTAKRLADFKKSIRQFVLAEWKENTAQRGIMRCYYVDGDGSELEAYVAKNHFLPNKRKSEWYQVSGSLDCAASMGQCSFDQQKMPAKYLANN